MNVKYYLNPILHVAMDAGDFPYWMAHLLHSITYTTLDILQSAQALIRCTFPVTGLLNLLIVLICQHVLHTSILACFKHFNSVGHSLYDLSIFVVEKIYWEDVSFCKAKESYWIRLLRSLAPERLNIDP